MQHEASLKIGDMDLYYRVYGDGQPLFLLHGFFGTGKMWDSVLAGLAEEFQLIVPDLRGHGKSNNPSKEFTHGQSAQDIFALADVLGINSFRAMGYSTGSMTLLHMATQQPQRVEAMLLFCPTSYFPESARKIQSGFSTLDKSDPEMLKWMRENHSGGDAQIQTLYDNFRAMADNHDDMDFTPAKLSVITARTLIVHGDRDEFFPIDIPVDLYRAIPNAGLWIVPYTGHGGLIEKIAEKTSQGNEQLKLPIAALEFLRGTQN
jgi:pimeloyl-ACP methyl ester carboxylesterase